MAAARLWEEIPIVRILPASRRLGDRLVGPARGEDLLERLRVGDVVELVDVDPVGLELPQRELEMGRRAGGVPRRRLGGDD